MHFNINDSFNISTFIITIAEPSQTREIIHSALKTEGLNEIFPSMYSLQCNFLHSKHERQYRLQLYIKLEANCLFSLSD